MTEQELLALIQRKMPFMGNAKQESKLQEDLGFDSVLLMDLILGIEDYCGMSFPDDEITVENLNTPRSIYQVIKRRMLCGNGGN
jgi:acyl carrier protein